MYAGMDRISPRICRTLMYTCMCTHKPGCEFMPTCVCLYRPNLPPCSCTHECTRMCLGMHVRACTHARIHNICIHPCMHTHTLALFRSLSLIHSLTLSLSHSLTLSPSHSHSHSLTHSHTHSLSHTHTQTDRHADTQTHRHTSITIAATPIPFPSTLCTLPPAPHTATPRVFRGAERRGDQVGSGVCGCVGQRGRFPVFRVWCLGFRV